jgi:hypothetical protein
VSKWALRGGDQPHGVLIAAAPQTRSKRKRHAGTAKGMIAMADDFDNPLLDFDEYTR